MLFRQLFDAASSTYTYLLGDPASGEALLIDPVFEQTTRDLSLLQELGLTLKLVVDTHAHADHVTAAAEATGRPGRPSDTAKSGPSCAKPRVFCCGCGGAMPNRASNAPRLFCAARWPQRPAPKRPRFRPDPPANRPKPRCPPCARKRRSRVQSCNG